MTSPRPAPRGLLVGAYHYYETGVPATEQGAYFTGALVGEILPLGVWIDWEPPTVPDWTVTGDYNAMVEEIEKARNPVGLYVDQSWHETFTRLNAVIKRLWLATLDVETAPPGVFIWQHAKGATQGSRARSIWTCCCRRGGLTYPRCPVPRSPHPVPEDSVAGPESVRASEGPAEASEDDQAAQTPQPAEPQSDSRCSS